jgi:hypothetical protein
MKGSNLNAVFANSSRSVIRITRQAMGIPTDLADHFVSPERCPLTSPLYETSGQDRRKEPLWGYKCSGSPDSTYALSPTRVSADGSSGNVRCPVNRPIAAHFHSDGLEFAYLGEDFG